jgi:hypothetical protein
LALLLTLDNENGENQVICRQSCFPHEAAAEIIPSHASHAGGRKLAIKISLGHGLALCVLELAVIVWELEPGINHPDAVDPWKSIAQ